MAAKDRKPRPAKRAKETPRRTVSRWALIGVAAKGLIAVGLVAGVVYAVAWLGGRAGTRVADRERYAVRVADIACDSPPGTDKLTFLTEVRYLGQLPETVQAVDPALPAQLSAAFARHPWVAEVLSVRVEPDTTIRVDLRFRVPVLAVQVAGEPEPRAVDRAGVLLPTLPPNTPLPLLTTPVLPPLKPAGEVWNDPTVKRAAELAETYTPTRIEKTDKGWRLTQPDGRVLVVSF